MLSHRAHLGPILAQVGPMLLCCSSWAHVGPMLGPCWPMLALWPMLSHLGSYVEAMFGPSRLKHVDMILRCQFFLPGPSSSPKPRKNRCFWTPQEKKTHGIWQGLQSGGVDTGWTGGGSAAGAASVYNLHHWRPPARTRAAWPAPGFVILCANPGRAMLNWGKHNAQCLPVWTGWSYVGVSWTMVGLWWPILGSLGP